MLWIAWVGWVFDIMDTGLFNFAKGPMFTQILGPAQYRLKGPQVEGNVQAVFLCGWALGGLVFGILADRWGRSRTLVATVLLYCAFTGLTALCHTVAQVEVARFLTAMGVGGEWAAGAALVAESFADDQRSTAASILQSAAAFGPMLAALANFALASSPWQWLFLVGIVPALIALAMRTRFHELSPDSTEGAPAIDVIREPSKIESSAKDLTTNQSIISESNTNDSSTTKSTAKDLGADESSARKSSASQSSPRETSAGKPIPREMSVAKSPISSLWRDKGLRTTTIAAILIGAVGVTGAATASYWQPNLVASVSQGLAPAALAARKSTVSMVSNLGTLAGVIVAPALCMRFGRRKTIAGFFVASPLAVVVAIAGGATYARLLVLSPLVNFFSIGVSAAFVLYFPELFPRSMRATGAGLAYNVGRALSIPFPIITGAVISAFGGSVVSGVLLSGLVYIVGLAAIPFAPETRGHPLPS